MLRCRRERIRTEALAHAGKAGPQQRTHRSIACSQVSCERHYAMEEWICQSHLSPAPIHRSCVECRGNVGIRASGASYRGQPSPPASAKSYVYVCNAHTVVPSTDPSKAILFPAHPMSQAHRVPATQPGQGAENLVCAPNRTHVMRCGGERSGVGQYLGWRG